MASSKPKQVEALLDFPKTTTTLKIYLFPPRHSAGIPLDSGDLILEIVKGVPKFTISMVSDNSSAPTEVKYTSTSVHKRGIIKPFDLEVGKGSGKTTWKFAALVLSEINGVLRILCRSVTIGGISYVFSGGPPNGELLKSSMEVLVKANRVGLLNFKNNIPGDGCHFVDLQNQSYPVTVNNNELRWTYGTHSFIGYPSLFSMNESWIGSTNAEGGFRGVRTSNRDLVIVTEEDWEAAATAP